MIQLDKTEENIKAALAGVLFDIPDGEPRELVYYKGELPEKREDGTQENDIAFCLIEPGGFKFGPQGMAQQVRATFVLFKDGTKADGLQMVSETVAKLQRLPRSIFAPCGLVGDIQGDHDAIEHPYYRFSLTFNLSTTTEAIP